MSSADRVDEFVRLLAQNQRRLYVYVHTLVPHHADAEEVLQNTNLVLWREFGTFEPGTNSRAWLLRIQYNLFCTQYRRGRRMPLVWLDEGEPDPALDLPSPEPGPEEQTVRELDREAVRRAIARLPEDFRMAVVLVDINGLSCAEAAGVMDVPRGTILSRLHRARRRLEAMLLPELGRVQADDL